MIPLLILFATKYYSGTHRRGETTFPIRNRLLLYISWPTFFTYFILLKENHSCVPVDISCNTEDMTIMSSFTQDDDNKSVMFHFQFGSVIRLIGEEQRGINSTVTVDSA